MLTLVKNSNGSSTILTVDHTWSPLFHSPFQLIREAELLLNLRDVYVDN